MQVQSDSLSHGCCDKKEDKLKNAVSIFLSNMPGVNLLEEKNWIGYNSLIPAFGWTGRDRTDIESGFRRKRSMNKSKADRKKAMTRGLALAVACVMVVTVLLAALLRM